MNRENWRGKNFDICVILDVGEGGGNDLIHLVQVLVYPGTDILLL